MTAGTALSGPVPPAGHSTRPDPTGAPHGPAGQRSTTVPPDGDALIRALRQVGLGPGVRDVDAEWCRRLGAVLHEVAQLAEQKAALRTALEAATHVYAPPAGPGVTADGCTADQPDPLFPGQVCGLPAAHPTHQTPDRVLDGVR